jgi:glycosyltransferase involved in cell wall biosynthesis
MKILFITRKYPPIKGGMEQYSYDLYTLLSEREQVTLLANTRGNKFLIPFLFYVSWFLVRNKNKFSNIHFGDSLLAFLIPFAKTKSNRVSITAHGLDVTYKNLLYQSMIRRFLRKANVIVCVSSYTRGECLRRGVSEARCIVIPNGIRFDRLAKPKMSFASFQKKFSLDLRNKKVLVSVGRLVKRKGHAWFVSNVMPRLSKDFVYLIAGVGPEREMICRSAVTAGVGGRVFLLGVISDEDKFALYSGSYVFVMPNIPVIGDPEGFGISLVEAASRGLPVVSSKLDGIVDAVLPCSGILVAPLDAEAFSRAIHKISDLKSSRVRACVRVLDWSNIVQRYLRVYSL